MSVRIRRRGEFINNPSCHKYSKWEVVVDSEGDMDIEMWKKPGFPDVFVQSSNLIDPKMSKWCGGKGSNRILLNTLVTLRGSVY